MVHVILFFIDFIRMLDWIKTKTNKYRKDSGKYNFHLKSEPQFIDSSTTLTLTAYSNLFQNATIPCIYRWTVIRNGIKMERPEFRGSSFRCQPADLGAVIQAEVISTDSEYNGTAIVHFGPVRLDIKLRKHIEIALNKGQQLISAHLVQEYEERQCQIRLQENMVRISHVYSEAIVSFDYSVSQPTIQCTSKDRNSLIIHFGSRNSHSLKSFKQKIFNSHSKHINSSLRSNSFTQGQTSDNCLQIKFANHSSRDTFMFVWKALITKRQLRSSMIFQRLQNVDLSKSQILDFMMEIEGFKAYLHQMDLALKKTNQEKKLQSEEIHKLKTQIQSLINAYTQAIEQNNSKLINFCNNSSFVSQKDFQNSKSKFRHFQNEKNHMNSRINALTNQIDAIRFQPKNIIPIRVQTEPMSEKSPFSKKKTQDDTQNFISLLEDLSSSRVSDISEIGYIRQDQSLRIKLQKIQRQNQKLHKKLQLSFHKIDKLEKQAEINQSGYYGSSQNIVGQRIHSSINNSPLHNTSVSLISINSPSNDSFISVKTQKKEPLFIESQDKELLALVMKNNNQISRLKQQIQLLQKANASLQSQLHSIKSIQIPKYHATITSLREQVSMYHRNSDVLNLSQKVCSQMTVFNEEQLQMLKKHNEFLTNENIKLSKACEKYMNEGRECTKLRMQIMKLREISNNHKTL